MPIQIREAKRTLREQMLAALDKISAPERASASVAACARLKAQALWTKAQSILFFAPMSQELDVWPLLLEALAAGRQVLLPRFVPATRSYEACCIRYHETDLQVGNFGIREPGLGCARYELGNVDLILVPGVAFDSRGGRLGRGKGYYDQLLRVVTGITCGIAFEQQIVSGIPVEPHDMHLDYILTPKRWIEARR